MKCPKCGYEWTPKVEKPKSCPECKVRLGTTSERARNIALDTIAKTLQLSLDCNGESFARDGKEASDDCWVFVQVSRGTLKNWVKAIQEASV